MKKIAFSLIALAALSTASFASDNRSNELRDSDTYTGKYAEQLWTKAINADAMAVMSATASVSNFDRLNWIAEENDNGGH
jgi:hypothetical protein